MSRPALCGTLATVGALGLVACGSDTPISPATPPPAAAAPTSIEQAIETARTEYAKRTDAVAPPRIIAMEYPDHYRISLLATASDGNGGAPMYLLIGKHDGRIRVRDRH